MAAGGPSMSFGIMEQGGDDGVSTGGSVQLQPKEPSNSLIAPPTNNPPKKKRNLPGTPYPDAEVIALSPKALLATNRFICEVCNKGFQREQNLQLHRRGHNLPWKLKQKSTKEVKRKVYLCPEPSCVHHDPSRALGDLTGIKKHFCRKHGEKKWKCEKCSKRYAVQSDWKAHSKTCGTREYRCDCGTLFSRRDSFITHRAFCDALAQESARLPSSLSSIGSQLFNPTSSIGLGLSHIGVSLSDQNHPSSSILRLGGAAGASQFDHLINSQNLSFRQSVTPGAGFFPSGEGSTVTGQDFTEDHPPENHHSLQLQNKPGSANFPSLMHLPDLSSNATNSAPKLQPSSIFNLGAFSKNEHGEGSSNLQHTSLLMGGDQFMHGSHDHMTSINAPSIFTSQLHNHESSVPPMSATALLQKAAQLGATTSNSHESLLRSFHTSNAAITDMTHNSNSSHDSPPMAINQLPMQDQRSPPSSLSLLSLTNNNNRAQMLPSFANMRTSFISSSTGEEDHHSLQQIMNSLANGGNGNMFVCDPRNMNEYGFNQRMNLELHGLPTMDTLDAGKLHQNAGVPLGGSSSNMGGGGGGVSDRLTRDFLGVGGMNRGFMGIGFSQREQQQQQQQQHNVGLAGGLDSDMEFTRSYRERNLHG